MPSLLPHCPEAEQKPRVRKRRLYRFEFPSFEAYCQAKWQSRRRYVSQLISAAERFTQVGASGSLTAEHETQIRPLAGLDGRALRRPSA